MKDAYRRVWGLCKSTFFVLLPDWHETEDASKSMRSLEVYTCCFVTWQARNVGCFEEYEVSQGQPLFCYLTGTKRRTPWRVMRSPEVYRCSATLQARNGGCFEEYEVLKIICSVTYLAWNWKGCKEYEVLKIYHSLLFSYGIGRKWRTLWRIRGLWRSTVVVLLPDLNETEKAFEDCQDSQGLT